MRSTFLKVTLMTAALACAGLLLTAGVSSAADFYLRAQSFDKALPGGATVPMWGFALCEPAWSNCAAPTATDAPGPRIDLSTTDTLTIHLDNTLPEPVSIVIPGQAGDGDPVWTTDGQGRQRVRSFTHEAAAGGTAEYTWSSLPPGTYLYQSGTHPSIQVPMGLYGALVVGPATGVACPAPQQAAYDDLDSCYDADALLLFSEIDQRQNQRVADAALLGPPTTACDTLEDWALGGTGYPCTVDYTPTYFLINGKPYEKTVPPPPLLVGAPGESVLLRLLNAGLRSHSPAIVGLDVALVAEDGNPYPGLSRQQSEALLPAGKTLDVLAAMPATDATYPLFDRMLDLTNDSQPDGGMLAYLQVGTGSPPPPPPPPPVEQPYAVTEDGSLIGALVGTGVTVVSGPSSGTLVLDHGTFTYTPYADFSGSDSFTYLNSEGTLVQVAISVSFENDLPVAANDGPYVNTIGPNITVAAPGVLGNDADPDGDTLTAVLEGGAPAGLTLNPDGSFTYTGGVATSFSYHADDGTGASNTATVTLEVNPVANIALTVEDPDGVAVDEYRWVVQEDATYPIDPAAPPAPADTLATNFHKSYMPVVAQGCVGVGPECTQNQDQVPVASFDQVALDPAKRYYVSILPNDAGTGVGHTIGGAQVPPGATAVTVIVNNQPIPTAQISVLLFEDISPTNGVPDPPEPGLGGWQINLEDAAGRYGQAGGTMSQDADGNPLKNWLPCAPPANADGVILTCPDGTALIKNLPPGKYGVFAVPAANSGNWTQTSTIEGTKIQDTWVKAGEPPFLVEFGAPGYHAFIGFVNPDDTTVPPGGSGSNTITGNVTMMHPARAPSQTAFDSGSYDGLAHTRAWVGVNSSSGTGPNIATVPAEPDGSFTIEGIPDGTHQLVVWDTYLDQIIYYQTVSLPGGGSVGNIPVPTWFGRHEHNVFLDLNGDGVRDPGEAGLPEQVVNLRFRDGTVFQSFPTDTEGFVPFDEIFPFGAHQIAEVDYTRFRPTGVTVTVDGGGDVSGGPYPGLLNPQVGSPRTDTENPPVLLEDFQSMPGMTSIFEWGKQPWEPGQNGGIAGIVFNGTTRGEEDPRLTVGDAWEAGIPGVTVRLYREVERDPDLGGGTALALVKEVQTDSWDASTPTGCQGESDPTDPFVAETLAGDATRCFDGIRNFEQVRPGAVFDGGYAFSDIPPGTYVVEVVPPTGYQVIKEEDVNVGFGDSFATAPVPMMLPGGAILAIMPDPATILAALAAEPGLAQPPCVGDLHEVPPYLSLFPSEMMEAPFAGAMRPLCDRKRVVLTDQGQAAADFHLFTSTPVAGQFYGLSSDDVAIETNPASPNFGDKWGPAFMPISMRDFRGQEIYRGYTDAFGRYNGLVPSTFSAHIPVPSGYSPAVHQVCLNDPGPIEGPGGLPILDPLRNPNYGNFCYTLMYMPGTTTYLDTPLLPQAAFAAGFNPVDCAFPEDTPVIAQVNVTGSGDAPWTDITDGTGTISIHAEGNTEVPNPAYEGPLAPAPYNEPTITRNYGFGNSQGSVTFDGVPLAISQWNQNLIRAMTPVCGAPPCTGQLVVTRANGESTVNAVSLTISNEVPIRVPADYPTVQEAIDAAAPGSLILVSPGLYEELVVMWKPVRLQGAGAGTTIINAVKRPPEKLDAWRVKLQGLIDDGLVDLLPGQPAAFDLVGPGLLGTELGAGITVLAKNDPADTGGNSFSAHPSRIDGFSITNADGGGGIFVNGYAHGLEISNNQVTGNSGIRHGGIRIGHPFLPLEGSGPFAYNTNVAIHHNAITMNGGQADVGAGGGVSLCTGSDNYTLSRNYICGNFHLSDGGGIGHLGLSDGGLIEFNQILFNQTFNQGLSKSGGGVLIAGEPPVVGALTLGAGNVTVDANLIQGNQAGSGHGGGVRTQSVNGVDASTSPWSVTFTNNMIVNNVAGWSGAGMSLQDTTNASIVNNTVADNDSTATVGALVVGNTSTPQPAGISAERHSLALAGELGDPQGFSDPAVLFNDIVWHNRTFTYDATTGASQLLPVLTPSAVGDCPGGASYWDLGVLGEPPLGGLQLDPTHSVLTDTTGYDGSNVSGAPDFLSAYCNGARTLSGPGPMQVAAEVVEGGNFIEVRYGPLTQNWPAGSASWDYHIGAASAGLDNGNGTGAPTWDFDNEARPQGAGVDRGADEFMAIAMGQCSSNADNAGEACLVDTDCPPNTGNPANRGTCVFP